MRGAGADAVADALARAGDRFTAAAEVAREGLASLPASGPAGLTLVGGARTAGAREAAAALLGPTSPIPVVLADGPELPAHVAKGTLVVATALGGLEHGQAALASASAAGRGAEVVVVAEGGRLSPPGGWAPSALAAASPAATAGLLEVLPGLLALSERAGLAPEGTVAEAAAALSAAAASFAGDQLALHDHLARRIGRLVPLFEGARGIGAVAARSWRRSWNLLAKAPAIAAAEPGATFSEIAGFGQHGDVTRQLLVLVSLQTALDPAEDVARSRLLVELAGEALAGELEVSVTDEGAAGALAHLEWLGIATAHARAVQEGLDPVALPVPGEVEARLAADARNRS